MLDFFGFKQMLVWKNEVDVLAKKSLKSLDYKSKVKSIINS